MNNTLHFVLKHKWWDMIESGEKPEEYRGITPLYIKRFCHTKQAYGCEHSKKKGECEKCFWEGGFLCHPYEYVCLHRGYTKTTMTFRCGEIEWGKGNPKWGAPKDKPVFITKFRERIET